MAAVAFTRALAGWLAVVLSSGLWAMTAQKKDELLALTADAQAMWSRLPGLAADARKTAALIQDLEAFTGLPDGLKDEARRNGLAAVQWCKELLPKQYRAETGNGEVKAFQPPAGAAPALIPKTLHFIWLGSPVPEPYRANIAAIAALNRDYQVCVWVDDQSQASAQACQGCRVRRVDPVLQDAPEEARAIYRLAVSKAGYRPNYAAASDILRMLVLFAEGGVYLDTDTCAPEGACGFGQLKAKYGFLVSTQTLERDGQFNNSPMAAVPGSKVLGELLALAGKRYRDAGQSSCGQGPEGQPWLHWIAAGERNDLRLASTVFLAGPVLVADYLSRVGHGWLKARNIPLDEGIQAGPPAVERFEGQARRTPCHCPAPVPPMEDYYFIDSIYGDFDLTSETFGLNHQFHNSWLAAKPEAKR